MMAHSGSKEQQKAQREGTSKKPHDEERSQLRVETQNSLQMQPCPAFHLLLDLSNQDWGDLHLSGPIILVSAEVQNTASTPVRIFCCVSM